MTGISPLLQSKINLQTTGQPNKTPNNRHEKIYQDLQKRAHEAKPNEAKAYLVKEGMLGNPITDVKDTIKDTKNFFKAVKTGQIGDNNLGRINDLGLTVGAAAIATYLAAHSKTKTESIMRFVGGGMFLAAMQLWPKLFINIPARLVHGFRIDRKYISAQGDKKDFFLDNQFLVWDAYPEDQLRKDAKNAGIDYDAKNGKEKIQRKMQKTALQNRTLWMATAGFATPLITSLSCNFIEPQIQKAVIKNGVNKAKKSLQGGFGEFVGKIKPQVENKDAVSRLIEGKEKEILDDTFFKDLSDILNPADFLAKLKDSDDAKVAQNYDSQGLIESLKKIRSQLITIDEDSLKKELPKFARKDIWNDTPINNEEIQKIIDSLKGDFSAENVRKALAKYDICDELYDEVSGKNFDFTTRIKSSNKKFFDFIEKLNEGPIAQMRARLKGTLDVINPVVGSKAESATTLEFEKTMRNIFDTLGISTSDMRKMRKNQTEATTDILSGYMQRAIEGKTDDDSYKAFIKKLNADQMDKSVTELIDELVKPENIREILPDFKADGVSDDLANQLKKAMAGGSDDSEGIVRIIKNFIEAKQVDITANKTKSVICANFERRLLKGEFNGKLNEQQVKLARKLLYEGNISDAFNKLYLENTKDCDAIIKTVLDKTAFATEKETLEGVNFDKILDDIKSIFKNGKSLDESTTPARDYVRCASLSQRVKEFGTRVGNNKAWLKLFGGIGIALVAVTLLAQPFFGKINKEFPDENKNGGAK